MRVMRSEKPFIIVTGAGRSGTSAVARVLHESGVRMGRQMAAATEANREGFYEDLDVVALNERLLADLAMSDPWRAERWATRAEVLAAARPYRNEMAALAAQDIDGWKDPRFAITLEAWLPLLPSAPKIIVCLRSPQAYADSVTRIYGLVKPERAMREWSRHYRRLLAVLREHKLVATCVEYDALIEQPAAVVEGLSRFVERPLDARYVEAALRRQRARVPEQYRALYERVARLGGESRGAQAKVSREGSRVKPRVETNDYAKVAGSLIQRLVGAKVRWESTVNMPELEPTPPVRVACDEYNTQLTQAQCEIAALVPPSARGREHEELRRRVDLERMIAQLALATVSEGDERVRTAAVRAWHRFGRAPIGARTEPTSRSANTRKPGRRIRLKGQEGLMAAEYVFIDEWDVKAPIESVFHALRDARTYPGLVEARVLGIGSGRAAGRRSGVSTALQGTLALPSAPELEDRSAGAAAEFEVQVEGDLTGRGVWTLTPSNEGVHVRFDWRVQADRPLLRVLTPGAAAVSVGTTTGRSSARWKGSSRTPRRTRRRPASRPSSSDRARRGRANNGRARRSASHPAAECR